jgi:hypothetical protein
VNYFFEGHDDKLTLEIGRDSLARAGLPDLSFTGCRLQWDVRVF